MTGVPDHRFDELMQRVRASEEQNQRLRGTVEALMARQPQQAQPAQSEESPFQPEVERALQARFEREMAKRLQPLEQQHRNAFGAMADSNDHLRFALQYGQDTYEKNKEKIERIREERSRQGQWVSREDAYRHIFFDENGKKPAVSPAPAQRLPEAPSIDPYTGMLREAGVADATPAQQAAQPAVNPPGTPAPVQVNLSPELTQLPSLPPQTVTPVTSPQTQQTQVPRTLDVGMGSADLEAWANKYGDIPV